MSLPDDRRHGASQGPPPTHSILKGGRNFEALSTCLLTPLQVRPERAPDLRYLMHANQNGRVSPQGG